MGYGYACFGQDFFKFLAAVFDCFDFVVQEIHLPAALELAQYGFADNAAVFAAQKGFDRQAALRRGGYDA